MAEGFMHRTLNPAIKVRVLVGVQLTSRDRVVAQLTSLISSASHKEDAGSNPAPATKSFEVPEGFRNVA